MKRNKKRVFGLTFCIVLLFLFLLPLIPESIRTPVTGCAGEGGFGCVGEMGSVTVTASIGFRLFSLGLVQANLLCEHTSPGAVNTTFAYPNFGSGCGEVTAWLW